jgi:hypothetical protein
MEKTITSVESVVRDSLMSRAGRRGLTVAPERPLRERLADLAREVDALPTKIPADTRSAEAVLGYDDHGQSGRNRGHRGPLR